MKFQKTKCIFAASILFLLILDGKTAMESARDGINLCLQSVVPSLFPFFVCSVYLTHMLSGNNQLRLKPVHLFFQIPTGAEPLLLTSFLGGYPVGAQCIASSKNAGCLTHSQACKMISFYNQAGPAFLFGIVGPQFSNSAFSWCIWAVVILSGAIVSQVLTVDKTSPCNLLEFEQYTLPEAMASALRSMGKVCGWVIIFRVILGFLQRWVLWSLPLTIQVLFTGFLELANGCSLLKHIPQEDLRFIIACAILSFGGLCVTMQTQSVALGLDMRNYMIGKLLQMLFAVLIAFGLVLLSRPGTLWIGTGCILLCIFPFFSVPFRNRKKGVAFSRKM